MESMQSVVDILGCSISTARVLLTFFRWDTEALFGALAERGPEWVYTAASVTSRSHELPSVTGALTADRCLVHPLPSLCYKAGQLHLNHNVLVFQELLLGLCRDMQYAVIHGERCRWR